MSGSAQMAKQLMEMFHEYLVSDHQINNVVYDKRVLSIRDWGYILLSPNLCVDILPILIDYIWCERFYDENSIIDRDSRLNILLECYIKSFHFSTTCWCGCGMDSDDEAETHEFPSSVNYTEHEDGLPLFLPRKEIISSLISMGATIFNIPNSKIICDYFKCFLILHRCDTAWPDDERIGVLKQNRKDMLCYLLSFISEDKAFEIFSDTADIGEKSMCVDIILIMAIKNARFKTIIIEFLSNHYSKKSIEILEVEEDNMEKKEEGNNSNSSHEPHDDESSDDERRNKLKKDTEFYNNNREVEARREKLELMKEISAEELKKLKKDVELYNKDHDEERHNKLKKDAEYYKEERLQKQRNDPEEYYDEQLFHNQLKESAKYYEKQRHKKQLKKEAQYFEKQLCLKIKNKRLCKPYQSGRLLEKIIASLPKRPGKPRTSVRG
jgi:hypothetical protein